VPVGIERRGGPARADTLETSHGEASGRGRPDELPSGAHVVQFYEDEGVVVDAVARFAGVGLGADDGVVLIATPAHLDAVEAVLRERGVDVAVARARGRYVTVDAAEAVAAILVDGTVDERRFRDFIDDGIARVAAPGRQVRIFGEMVADLVRDGNVDAALRLERLGAALAAEESVTVFCAYPHAAFASDAGRKDYLRVCDLHTDVRPAEIPAIVGPPVDARGWLAALVTSSDDAIVSKTTEGIVTSWNRSAERIFGWTAEEMIGTSITRIIPPDRADEEPAVLARIRRGDRVEHFETQRVRKDGRRIDVALTISPIRNARGEIVGASKIARDVTDRKNAERALAHLAAIVESSDDTIIGKTLDGIVTSWNAAAERMFGYTADEMIGQSITRLVPSDRPDDVQKILARIRAGERVEHHETQRVRKDGTRIDVSLTVSPIKDAQGRIVGASKIARDVTERKRADEERERLLAATQRARAEAEAANRAKDELLSMVSHELRTPLAAILGWVGVLKRGNVSAERRQRALETIEQSGRLQSELIEDLLDVSRIVTGRLRLTIRPIDLGAPVRSAVDAARPDATAKRIDLDCRVAAGIIVAGDTIRLQQVAANLVGNAVKFTPPGGRVRVEVTRGDDEARIVVHDTGRGIAPEFLPEVFEAFRQADDVRSRTRGGLGLGLAIARSLVERHGGRIAAESPGVGAGATFTVRLPVLPATARLPARDDLAGLRVLLVDDEPGERDALRASLEGRGAAVEAAAVADAGAALRTHVPDVVVADVQVAGDGLVGALRADPRLQAVTAIALTGPEPDGVVPAGFHAYVAKPADANGIIAVIGALAPRGEG